MKTKTNLSLNQSSRSVILSKIYYSKAYIPVVVVLPEIQHHLSLNSLHFSKIVFTKWLNDVLSNKNLSNSEKTLKQSH